MPIHVLSRDGQSILGSRDTLTGGVQCAFAHPFTVPGWSEYLGISGYSDRGAYALPIHVLSRDGQSILGSRDTLTGGGCSVHVPIHVLSRDGQSILGSQDTLTGGVQCACAHPCTVPGSVSCDLETL